MRFIFKGLQNGTSEQIDEFKKVIEKELRIEFRYVAVSECHKYSGGEIFMDGAYTTVYLKYFSQVSNMLTIAKRLFGYDDILLYHYEQGPDQIILDDWITLQNAMCLEFVKSPG